MTGDLRHVAFTNWSSRPDAEIAPVVEAARTEVVALCRAWGLPVPGVQFYPRDIELPSSEAIIVSAVDSDGNPETLGYHTTIAGTPTFLWEVGAGPWVALHEIHECIVNPYLTRWAQAPDGSLWWIEACDACQSDWYPVDVELFGTTTRIMCANWLKPAFFGLPNHDGTTDFDRMGVCRPFEVRPGGYTVRTVGGRRDDLGARSAAKGCSTSRSAQCPVR